MTALVSDLGHTDDGMHPVHGEFDCHDIEDSNKRAWDKVNDLTSRVAALDSLLDDARRASSLAASERDANNAAVENLTDMLLESDAMIGELQGQVEATRLAGLFLPNVNDVAASVWRSNTGKSRGPVATAWFAHLASEEASNRIAEAIAQATEEAIRAEYANYSDTV